MLLTRRLPRFFRRLDHLSGIISKVEALPKRDFQHIYSAEKAIIEFQIEWEHFVRDLILDSATGQYYNSNGRISSRSHPNLHTREAAAHKLITLYPKRSFEPDWYLPSDAINAALLLDVSNANQIAAELGVTPWEIDELRHLRNFIAHKSKRSALKIRSLGVVAPSNRIDVLDIALQYVPNGVQRYIDWISFTKGVATRLTK